MTAAGQVEQNRAEAVDPYVAEVRQLARTRSLRWDVSGE
jgi:hypothetical protein